MIVACQICGSNFEADRRTAKNCSEECRSEYRRRRLRQWRAENPELNRQKYQEWYQKNGLAYQLEWQHSHPEYQEKQNERRKQRNKVNPEPKKQADARYYQRHKEQIKANVNAWKEAHPENARQVRQRSVIHYRARLANAEGKWTTKQFRELCEAVDWHCAYCHKQFDKLTADHILPVSRGGSNDITNIIPACLPCNTSKRDKTPLEFLSRFTV